MTLVYWKVTVKVISDREDGDSFRAAYRGDTGGGRERRGETALIPAHSTKGKNSGIPFRASCSMRPPFVCFSSSSSQTHYPNYIRINAPNDRFRSFLPPEKKVIAFPSLRMFENLGDGNRSIDRFITGAIVCRRTRSIRRHDGATSFASVQPASPVSGRSGANRRIGGKMAKVSRESRGAALRPDQPTAGASSFFSLRFHLKILSAREPTFAKTRAPLFLPLFPPPRFQGGGQEKE